MLQPISARRVSDLSHFAVMEMSRACEMEQAQLQAELENIMRDDGRDASHLNAMLDRHRSSNRQLPKPQTLSVKIPRLDLSVISQESATGLAGSSPRVAGRAAAAAWDAVVTDRTTRQTFLFLNSSLSPRAPQSPAALSPSTKIFDLTQPRLPPAPPSCAAPDHAASPLLGSARKLVVQQQRTPRRFPIEVEGHGPAAASSISDLHKAAEQRLLHVILTNGVLRTEMKKMGLDADDEAGIVVADVNRLAKRMFPSLHPSISCANIAPVMCGIVGEGVRKDDVASLLLAMVYSSFVADFVGNAEIVTKEALLQCISRLHITQSAHPEACDGVIVSALAAQPGAHSTELFCLWFVKMHMAMMLGKLTPTSSNTEPTPSLPAKVHSQEILRMLRLHSNSAVEHLRAVNACMDSGSPRQQRHRNHNGRAASRDTDSSEIAASRSRSCSPPHTARAQNVFAPSAAPDAAHSLAEDERRRAIVNSARTCISASSHLVRLAQDQGVVGSRRVQGNHRNHVLENMEAVQLHSAATKARAFYNSIAAIERRISALHRAQQQQLARTCAVAQALVLKSVRSGARRTDLSKSKSGLQMLLMAAVVSSVRFALMCKRMQKERHFVALDKNSAAFRLCRFLKSLKGVMQVRREAHMKRQQALRQRSCTIIVRFFKLFLPRMRRLRRVRAAAVIAESLRETRRGWGSQIVKSAMSRFLTKVRIVQKQARLFLSRAAANKRWLEKQFRQIEKKELVRVYGGGKKGTLLNSDFNRLMMPDDVRRVALEQLWKALRREFGNRYTVYQMERKMHIIRLQEMSVFRRGMMSYIGRNQAAVMRLPEDVRGDMLSAYNPPVPPSYKQCMRPPDDELLQIVRIAQYDGGRPLDSVARRGVSAYAKQRRKQHHGLQKNQEQEQKFAALESMHLMQQQSQ